MALAAAVHNIHVQRFVEHDDENAVGQRRRLDQRIDMSFEPVISGRQFVRVQAGGAAGGAIMRIVFRVGRDESKVWHRARAKSEVS